MKLARRLGLAYLFVIALAGAARADARTAFGTEAVLTRYGTSYETVNVLTLDTAVEVNVGPRLAIGGRLPVSTTFIQKNACCGYSLGNATGTVRYALEQETVELDLLGAVSLPTASSEGGHGATSRLAATSAVTRDAGLYLPGITTTRLGVALRAPVGQPYWFGVSAAAHFWLAGEAAQHRNQVLMPFEVSAGRRLTSRLTATGAFTTIASPTQRDEAFVHEASAGLAYAGESMAFGARVHLPLDEYFRRQGMLAVGANVITAF